MKEPRRAGQLTKNAMKIIDERPQYLVTRITEFLETLLPHAHAWEGASLLREARDTLQHLLKQPAVQELLVCKKDA